MRCVLYVHNHDARGGQLQAASAARVCGMAVGENPTAQPWDSDRPVTSFAEFVCRADLDDPSTWVQIAVGRAVARSGELARGQTVELRTKEWSLRLALEPGFDDPRAVLEPLLALARALCIKDGRVVSVAAAS
jgi:hypothetical protein